MRTYRIDMSPGKVGAVINASQYDYGYEVQVTLYEGSVTYQIPSGASIRVEGTKSDAKGFSYECRAANGIVYVPIQIQMTAVQGDVPCELVVYKDGLRVGSCNFTLAVEESALDGDTDISETDIPAIIAEATEQMEAAASSASQARTSATQAASSAASAETAKTAAMDAAQDAIDAAQELQTAIQFNAALIHETASGAVASFADGADDIPMQSVVAEITPVQSGSGDPSPTNIRPISGLTGMTVTAAGKNLLSPALTYGLLSTTIGALETDVSQSTRYGYTERFPSTEAVTFSAKSLNATMFNYAKILQYVDGVLVAQSNHISINTTGFISATMPARENSYCRMIIGSAANDCGTEIQGEAQVEVGSTATAYEPYAATEYPVTWESIAGTVYGGTLDVVSGVLTVTHTMLAVDGVTSGQKFTEKSGITTADVYGVQASNGDNLGFKGTYISKSVGNANRFVCDIANYDDFVSAVRDYIYFVVFTNTSGRGISLRLSFPLSYGFDTTDKANAYLKQLYDAGTPVQFVYPLATPQTYQLTPTEVRTLLGGNNIYTDAGSVSVEYVADTKMYIDGKIAELQALVLEN